MLDRKIETSFTKLKSYVENEDFKGYDPYDGLNSRLFQATPFSKSRFFRLAWIQIFKRLPFNLRPWIGIEKGENPKGLALFLSGYCALFRKDPQGEYLDRIKDLANRIICLQSKGFSGACWGYNFDWQARAFFQPKGFPTVVATSFCVQALLEAYEITQESVYLEVAISAKDFVLKDLNRTKGEKGFCLSYSPKDKTEVYNASLLGARLLAQIYDYSKEPSLKIEIQRLVTYALDVQNEDGSWYYSPLHHHKWIDSFHTGFNLECLYECNKVLKSEVVTNAIEKGVGYYLAHFFTPKGESKYYNDRIYPIDLHAPAQLLVTLKKIGQKEKQQELIAKVLTWTIDHMQSEEGWFYYQRSKKSINRNNYMRWTQAWMFYGMVMGVK